MSTCIALDAMGGDPDPSGQHAEPYEKVVAASHIALTTYPDIRFILVGQEDKLRPALAMLPENLQQRIEIEHAADCISMDEAPVKALRQGRKSSMWGAIKLVQEGRANACVSAGNTGALMVIAKYLLKTLPGIDRPAITSPMPNS
ncbi:MAG: phosphate acyltransferase, partial [Pseudomonadota bacterium]